MLEIKYHKYSPPSIGSYFSFKFLIQLLHYAGSSELVFLVEFKEYEGKNSFCSLSLSNLSMRLLRTCAAVWTFLARERASRAACTRRERDTGAGSRRERDTGAGSATHSLSMLSTLSYKVIDAVVLSIASQFFDVALIVGGFSCRKRH